MRWPVQMAEAGAEGGVGGGGGETAPGGETRESPVTTAGQEGGLLDWRTSLPEALRSASIIQRHTSMEAAAKSLIAQDTMLGRALFLPEDTADDATKQAALSKVYTKLGRPDTADAYTFPVPEGRAMDPEITGRWQKAFHMAGLSQAQVQAVMDEYWRTVGYAENLQEAAGARSGAEGQRALEAEFGASTEEYLTKARGFFEHMGAGAFGGKAGQEAWEQIMQARLPDGRMLKNSPQLIAAFAEAGSRIGEGEWYESSHYVPGQNTAETLQARQRELTAKRHGGTITAAEHTELAQIFTQLAAHQERTGRRVA